MGDLIVSSTTVLETPPDGVFHVTSFVVEQGVTVWFTKNAKNTPIYILSKGDIIVRGALNLSGGNATDIEPGIGGPGGFDGGWGGHAFSRGLGSDGQGPGGGAGGTGWREGQPGGTASTRSYGNAALLPLVGGSGGGGSFGVPGGGGGGGGGALLLASDTLIRLEGNISSRDSNGFNRGGSGSGGTVRLVAPIVGGTGRVDVGISGSYYGRIRIDTLNHRAPRSLRYSTTPSLGSNMRSFPHESRSLSVVYVAGTEIPEGTEGPVSITLVEEDSGQTAEPSEEPNSGLQLIRVIPKSEAPTVDVTVRARGFEDVTPVQVVVYPENGSRGVFEIELPASEIGPTEASVAIDVPVGVVSRIFAWTKPN